MPHGPAAGEESRPRIVMVMDWFFYYSATIANALVEQCDVMLVTYDYGYELGIAAPAGDLKRDLLDDRVQLHLVRHKKHDPRSLAEVVSAVGAVRRFRPDVIHMQDLWDWRLGAVARMSRSGAHLLTIHDTSDPPDNKRDARFSRRVVRRMTWGLADGYIVHGKALDRQLRAVYPVADRAVFSIPHGVLQHPVGSTPLPEEPALLFFGRMAWQKGVEEMIEVSRMLGSRYPGIKVTLAGKGSESARLKPQTAGEKMFEWIDRFIPDEELPDLFARASLVVLPYVEATQSGVVPLAFANGRTVVATRVGALDEAIEDGRTGLLCDPGDLKGMASAISRLLDDRELLRGLSEEAEKEVTTGPMSMEHVSALHMDAYRSIAKATQRS